MISRESFWVRSNFQIRPSIDELCFQNLKLWFPGLQTPVCMFFPGGHTALARESSALVYKVKTSDIGI